MVLLTLFALVAGAGTAITPCILPVLPALLSAGATGGRRRPLGIVTGLAVAYTIAIVALASVVKGVGVSGNLTRDLAIAVLLGFGVILAIPPLAARIEAWLSRLSRFVPTPKRSGDGFWSGTAMGAALGLLAAPCAGPILAAVISVSATRGASLKLVVIGFAYAVGLSAVLLLLALGGRKVVDRIRHAGRSAAVQPALGAVLVLTGVAMAANLDTRFETALAAHVPSFLTNPTKSLEDSAAVKRRLTALRGKSKFDSGTAVASTGASLPAAGVALKGVKTPSLPRLGPAPDFQGTQRWFDTPGNKPLSLAQLRGRVVLVDFWTYTCINCLRTLPFLTALDARYRSAGLTIVGVHTPEFSFEHDAGNVRRSISQAHIRYPVAQDNGYATWNAWGNQYWPAEYLIDSGGQVRHTQFGEGDYKQSEAAVRALLAEAGARSLPPPITAKAIVPSALLATPETYLGTARADPQRLRVYKGVHDYGAPPSSLPLSAFALTGTWQATPEAATAVKGAGLEATFQAADVYLVLSSAGGKPRRIRVLVDGRPAGTVTVTDQRLYRLVHLPRAERHRLTLQVANGLSGYAFTFG
ncbi:MAG: cytochrome c biosis protein DipZ [Solirubrobacterales bacterium]|nr:cytochrome c biosis protein DipZ [Solirubrobacterales bacterium]